MRIYGGVMRSEKSIAKIREYARHRYHNDKTRLLAQQKLHRATSEFKMKHAEDAREYRHETRARLLMFLGGHVVLMICAYYRLTTLMVMDVKPIHTEQQI